MTKLVKYLVIGGSTTAVVGGGAAGAAVAISHKSSNDKVSREEQAKIANTEARIKQFMAIDAKLIESLHTATVAVEQKHNDESIVEVKHELESKGTYEQMKDETKGDEVAARLRLNFHLATHEDELNVIFMSLQRGVASTQEIYAKYPDDHELVEKLNKIAYIHDNPTLLEKTVAAIESGVTTYEQVAKDYAAGQPQTETE